MGPLKAWMAAFAALCLLMGVVPAQAMDGPNTGLRLFAPQARIAPGQAMPLAAQFDVQPGWHLYWKNPGDTGLAPMVRWSGVEGADIAPLVFPTPQTFSFAGFTNYGYLEPFTLLTQVTLPPDASGKVMIEGAFEWLACDDQICVPEAATASITLTVDPTAAGLDIAADPYFAQARKALPLSADWPGKAAVVGKNLVARFEVPFFESDISSAEFFPSTPAVIVYEELQTITWPAPNVIEVRVAAQTGALTSDLDAVLKITPTGGGPVQGYALSAQSVATESLASSSASDAAGAVSALGLSVSLPTALLFALLGGLILNLMPCVFPVLSLKALSLAKSGDDSARARRDGWLYTAGILASFAALAAVLLALRSAGSQLGWGFQLQSPIVVAGLTLVMFVIGLNLLGAFEVSGRFAGSGQSWLDRQSGGAQSFFTGVLATIVATPCTAPFMASALSFAITQPAPASIAIFLCLGLGLALPFLALAYLPWLRQRLPRPGAWMETFKQALAFPMFLTALWLLWVLSNQGGTEAVILTLGIALLISFALWALQRGAVAGGNASKVYAALGVGAIIIGALGLWQIDYSQTLAKAVPASLNEEPFSQERLAQLVAEDAPVFVYFTADWCITCKANERLALNTADVKAAFEAADVTILKADWTRRDAEIASVLATFGRAGVPLYLYYAPGAGSTPQELPQILRQGMLIDLVKDGAA